MIALFVFLAGVALLIRRWWTAALPLLAWPIFYAGLQQGWWGYGVGDGWQLAAVSVTVGSIVAVLLAVLVGRALLRRPGPNSRASAGPPSGLS